MDLDCFEVMYRYYVTVSAGKNNIMVLTMIILWCCVLRFRMYLWCYSESTSILGKLKNQPDR